MKLLTLALRNFRQHAQTDIDFRAGMTAIVGSNGCGKSTILEAITFALFGENRSDKGSIRFHWADSKKYSVELRFESDGRRFRVQRTESTASFEDTTAEASTVLATGLSEVTKAVEKRLGLTYEQFVNSFCAEQKGLAFLAFKSNAARQEEVARMLGFDRLQKAEELARAKKRDASTRVQAIALVIGDIDQLRTEQKAIANQVTSLDEEAGKVQAALEGLVGQRESVAQKAAKADRYRSLSLRMGELGGKAEGLKAAVTKAASNLLTVEELVRERESIATKATEYDQAEASLAAMAGSRNAHAARQTLSGEIGRLSTEITSLEAQLGEPIDVDAKASAVQLKQSEKERAETLLQESEAAWREAQTIATNDLSTAKADLRNAIAARDKAAKLIKSGLCPECGQPLGESVATGLEALSDQVTSLEATVKDAQGRVEALQTAPDDVQERRGYALGYRNELTALESDLTKARLDASRRDDIAKQHGAKRTRLDEATKERDALPDGYDAARDETLRQQLASLKPSKDRYLALGDVEARLRDAQSAKETADADLKQAAIDYSNLKTERTDLGFANEEAVQQAEKAAQDLRVESERLSAEFSGLCARLEDARHSLESANERITEHGKREAELAAAKVDVDLFECAAHELKGLRLALNQSIGPDLAARASENLCLLTGGRYPTLTLDASFAPSLVDEGVSKTVISGGEEDVVALSLRLALSELIQERQGRPMSLLILDEVFGSLDAERRQGVLDRLFSLKGRFAQILVISHIEEINQIADSCLYVSRDPNTKSSVVSDNPTGDPQ